jgi:hypothetical protein
MKNIIVCIPTSIQGYQPPFEATTIPCDVCGEDIWVPANEADYPEVEGDIESIQWMCCRCFTNLIVHDQLDEDTQIHLLTDGYQDSEEDRLFMLSQMQLDQDLTWVEENLGEICKAANKVFPDNDDPLYRLLWQSVLIFVWEVLQRRRDGLIGDEQVFDRWSAEEAKHIMKFILWKPNHGRGNSEAN